MSKFPLMYFSRTDFMQFDWQFPAQIAHQHLMNILFVNGLPFTRARVDRPPTRSQEEQNCPWYCYTVADCVNVFIMGCQEDYRDDQGFLYS